MVSAPVRLLVISASPSLAHAVDSFMRRMAVQVKSQWLPANQKSRIDQPERLEVVLCPKRLQAVAERTRSEFAPQTEIIALPDSVDTDTPDLNDATLPQRCVEAAEAVRERDVVARLSHQIEVLQSRLQQLQDEAGIAEADLEGGIVMRANGPFVELIGAENWDDLEATPLLDWVAPSDQAHVKNTLKVAFDQGELSSCLQFSLARAPERTARFAMRLNEAGGERILQIVCTPGESGSNANAVFVGRRRLEDKLAEWPNGHAGLVHVWIDDFHDIEVRAGHSEAALVADELEVALRREVSPEDDVFRFGLDEYIVWVNGENDDAIASAGQRLVDAIAQQRFEAGPISIELQLKTDQVALPDDIQTESLLKSLRNTYLQRNSAPASAEPTAPEQPIDAAPASEEAQEDEDQGTTLLQLWRDRILDALKHNRFHMAYQGISPLESGPRAYEVLVQLVTSDGEQHRLREFRELAEMAGLLGAIDRWVIGQAIARLAEPGTRPTQIFLKLSRNTVEASEQFLHWLEPLLEKTPKLARYLIFEVAENQAVRNAEAVGTLLKALRGLGAQTALFAVQGPSSGILPELGLNWIRLSSKVYGYGRTDDALPPHFKDLLAYAREHELTLIAPETRTAATLARLWQWGVKYIRGEPVENEVMTIDENIRRRPPQLNVANAQ